MASVPASPGDPLHFLSNPQRLEALWIYSGGSLRQHGHFNLGQTMDGPDPAVLIVQAPLGEGDAGGLALDGRGDVAGIISGKVGPQQQVAFCLAAAEIQTFLDDNRPRWDPQSAADLCARGVLFVKAGQLDRGLLPTFETRKCGWTRNRRMPTAEQRQTSTGAARQIRRRPGGRLQTRRCASRWPQNW